MGIDLTTGEKVVTEWHTPALRPAQKQLWKWHEEDRKKIGELAGKDPIIFLEMGDLTQGNKFTDDLDTTSLSSQVAIAAYSMYPWLDMPQVKKCYMVKGTGVHVWGEGSTETLLSAHLRERYPKKQIKITDHYLLDIDGYLVDMAHHGPGAGIRAWTRGNVLQLYGQSILMDDVMNGRLPPDLILRGHMHEYVPGVAMVRTGSKMWMAQIYITPPQCFIGSHAQKAIKSPSQMTVGMMAFEIINGRPGTAYPFIHCVDLRTREIV